MKQEQIQEAVARGPFTLHMADGKAYQVPSHDYIWFRQNSAYVMIADDEDYFHILPLLMISGLSFQEA